jgi:hypothetical protein
MHERAYFIVVRFRKRETHIHYTDVRNEVGQ